MLGSMRATGVLAALLSVGPLVAVGFAASPWPLLFQDDFEQGASHWQTSDPGKPFWKVIDCGDGKAYRVIGKSDYQPPVRSPHSIALIKDLLVTDFELTARVQSTNDKAGNHRDLCFFWGYQDPSHFYYVHLGRRADPHACQIFIVNGAPRTKITVKEAAGVPWDDRWHRVKIVRRVADGTMEVYFDDMETPLMTARDKTFRWGQVGIGTFDDHGNFDDITVRGIRHQ